MGLRGCISGLISNAANRNHPDRITGLHIMNFTISVSESRAARLKTLAPARRANAVDALLLAICFGAAAGIAGIVCLAIVRGIMAGA